jgi:hypothetical protein
MAANLDGGFASGEAPRWEDSGLSDEYTDLPTLAIQRLTGLATGLVEFVRAQPIVAAAVLAALLGAVVGVGLARRPRPSARERLVEAVEERVEEATRSARRAASRGARAGGAVQVGELVGLAMRLLENPLVRGYLLQIAARKVAQRFK